MLLLIHTAVKLVLTGSPAVASDNLELVDNDSLIIIEFDVDVFNDEGPDVITESIRVQVALEAEFGLNHVAQVVGSDPVKVRQHLHCQLWLYTLIINERIERICQGGAHGASSVELVVRRSVHCEIKFA